MVSSTPRREQHYAWKGDQINAKGGRLRAWTWFDLSNCELCGAPGHDRHHKDGNPVNNDPSNIQSLCRRCHMELDGRAQKLREANLRWQAKRVVEQTECKNGHSLTDPSNVYRRPDRPDDRNCRRCRAEAEQRRSERLAEKYGPCAHHLTKAQRDAIAASSIA